MGPRAGLDGGKSRHTGIRSPDRPARSLVALPSELRDPHTGYRQAKNIRFEKVDHLWHAYFPEKRQCLYITLK